MFVSVFQPFVNVGQFIGAIVSNALKGNLTKHSYQIQLAILYVVPTFLFFAVWFVPESPRWLAVHDRNEDAARSLARIRPRGTTQEDLDNELKDIMESIRLEREIAQTTSWFDIWKGPDLVIELLAPLIIPCSNAYHRDEPFSASPALLSTQLQVSIFSSDVSFKSA